MSGKILRMSGHGEQRMPAAEFAAACEVKEVSPADWLRATVGAHMPRTNVRGEKVVDLKAAPPEDWAIVDAAVTASKNGGKWDVARDRFDLQTQINGGL